MEASWAVEEAPWSDLGRLEIFWRPLGDSLGGSWRRLEVDLGRLSLSGIWKPPGGVLGILKASWKRSWTSWRRLGGFLGQSGAVLEAFWKRSWAL